MEPKHSNSQGVKFSLRNDSETNIAGYSAATIMNSLSEADTTESEIGSRRNRRRRNRADSIVVSTDPSEHVMFLLGGNDGENDEPNAAHSVFCELDELCDNSGVGLDFVWKETARWIKFEEDVEENGERWSKPHVATLSLFSLFEVRNFLNKATMFFNLETTTMDQIASTVVDSFIEDGKLDALHRDKTIDLLLKRHTHLHDKMKHKMGRTGTSTGLPLIRSLADIGKKNSSKDVEKEVNKPYQSIFKSSFTLGGEVDLNGVPENAESTNSVMGNFDYHFMKKIPQGAETSNILVGETDYLSQAIVAFVRLKDATVLGEITEVPVPTRFLFILLGPTGNGHSYKEIGRSMATLMSDEVFHEVAYKAKHRKDILAGIDEFLSSSTVLPPGEWDPSIRIEPPAKVPSQECRKISQIPNGSASLGPNPTFTDLTKRLAQITDSETPGQDKHEPIGLTTTDGGKGEKDPNGDKVGGDHSLNAVVTDDEHDGGHGNDPALQRTGKFCGGLIADIKRRKKWYLSDFTDALNAQCVSSFLFLYFACLAPIITFGGLLSQETGGYLGTIESILSGAVVGIIYALFSGQPLTIQGSTGPVLVFEKIVFSMCKRYNWAYLSFRLWIGLWTSLMLLIMVCYDLSSLVKYITRFTEESFATLIALIFIIKAFEKVIDINKYRKFDRFWTPGIPNGTECKCKNPLNVSDADIISSLPRPIRIPLNDDNVTINWSKISSMRHTWNGYESIKYCKEVNGSWEGDKNCSRFFVPDVFFFSCLIFLATFFIAYSLKALKNSQFFPSKVRSIISDFAVPIAIFSCTLIDYLMSLHTLKLNVPSTFAPTNPDRTWLVPFFDNNPWWTSLVAIGPALLATILLFMDQQITAVIVNRRENKLVKGAAYHLDLLIMTITIIINSIIGIPWFVAATVLSLNHVMSLRKESETSAPGEKPVFLGCREQRMTGFLIFLLTGLSVFMTPVLSLIPMAVLYGVFLYMGVASLKGVQIVDRILLFFTPVKYQPDYPYLRHVRLRRVHLFTFIQIFCFVMLWVIKEVEVISITFPLMVLAMCFIRKLLDFIFTQNELKWLDDIMPNAKNTLSKKKTEHEISMGSMKPVPSMEKRINITEEVGKTMIWRNLSGSLMKDSDKQKKKQDKRKNENKLSDLNPKSDSDADDEALLKSDRTITPVRFLLDNKEIITSKSASKEMKTSSNLMTPEITINPPSGRTSPNLIKKL